jgi:H+/Cl- antiporter ClcA
LVRSAHLTDATFSKGKALKNFEFARIAGISASGVILGVFVYLVRVGGLDMTPETFLHLVFDPQLYAAGVVGAILAGLLSLADAHTANRHEELHDIAMSALWGWLVMCIALLIFVGVTRIITDPISLSQGNWWRHFVAAFLLVIKPMTLLVTAGAGAGGGGAIEYRRQNRR